MATFAPRLISVGTTPIVVLNKRDGDNFNNRRKQYIVIFLSTSKVSGNTGLLYLGIGSVPNQAAGAGVHVMSPGDQFSESTLYNEPNLAGTDVTQDALYAVASAGNQQIEIIEVV